MILLPDLSSDWTLYQNFIERNRDRYTMYAVTLPGYGRTPPPPRPEFFDPTATPWWDNAGQAVVKLIERNRLNNAVVVGTPSGRLPGCPTCA